MNTEPDADSGEAPDAVDRLLGRKRHVDSLPGPSPRPAHRALGPPSPTVESAPERIPAAELSVSPEHVYVTVELPGAPKETLDIEATDRVLTVSASRTGAPPYRLELPIPVRVDPGSARATYRNGILDVTLDRVNPGRGDDHGA